MRTFKLAELLSLSGATANQVQYWLREGWIVPLKDAKSSGDHREFSLQNVVEATLATWAVQFITTKQVKILFATLQQSLAPIPDELRASAVFIRYVEIVDATVKVVGEGPNYREWRAEVEAFIRSWKRVRHTCDEERLLSVLVTQTHPSKGNRDGAR